VRTPTASGAGRVARAGRRPCAPAVAIALVVAASGRHATAHVGSATFGDVARAGREVAWTLRVRVADLAGPEVGAGLARGADMTAALARAAAIEDLLARGLAVQSDGAPCPLAARALGRDDTAASPTVVARLGFACARAGGALTLRYDLFFALDPLHSGYTRLDLGDGAPTTHVFRARERAFAASAARSMWASAREYLALGVEHIFTGYDHLAFLAALLLGTGLARRSGGGAPARANGTRPALRAVLAIVTAFTCAHSLTLIVSTLRPGLVGTRWVEPAIAASIAYVGLENLVPRTPRRRWVVVFAFGLVHGLGFSSVLREIGLPARGLVLSLLAFNLGVELGQLAVVSLVLPLVLVAARRSPAAFERWILRGGSAVLALAGAIWFVLRVRP
jgi:HupE / UreJ protein